MNAMTRVSAQSVVVVVLMFGSTLPAWAQRPDAGARGGARLPEGVQSQRDLQYAQAGEHRLLLDLYLPAAVSAAPQDGWPLIIWVHGGGWQNGSKEQWQPPQSMLARGYAVASINYRLSHEATYPAQIEDCKAAVRWLRAHAKEYGLAANHFAAWGSSAGGHLVALLGTTGEVAALEGKLGEHLDQSSRVQAVVDYYGPTDFTAFVQTRGYERHADAGSPESKLLGGAVLADHERAQRANPIAYVTADDPPFFIAHGTRDGVVPPPQSELLHAALEKAGVASTLRMLDGAGHGGPQFVHPELVAEVVQFLDQHLKPYTGTTTTGRSPQPATPRPRPAADQTGSVGVDNFQLQGDRWTATVDGQSLAGILVRPTGDGPFPAIVISHGMGSNAENFARFHLRTFLDWGFVCIATNYTHSAQELQGKDRSTYGGSEENLKRAGACLQIVRSLPYVDQERIVAYGHSMGSFVTLALAAAQSDQLAAIVVTGTGTALNLASDAHCAKIRTPTLIVHGALDRTVPPERSARLKAVLDQQQVPNERHVMEGVNHNVHQEQPEQVMAWMRAWLERYEVMGG